jgi:hypothetical protein
MGGQSRGQGGWTGPDEIHRLGRGDVLEHHLETRVVFDDRHQTLLDETALPVEDIHSRVRDLSVHKQRQPLPTHGLEHRVQAPQVGHPILRVGRGAGRIELAGPDDPACRRGHDLSGRCLVGEVERHQGLEAAVRGQGRQ